MSPACEAECAALRARLAALAWLVRHQQSLCESLCNRLGTGALCHDIALVSEVPASAHDHLQKAVNSLAACALALAADGADQGLANAVAVSLGACAALAECQPLAQAVAVRDECERPVAMKRLAHAEAETARVQNENRALRATIRALREQAKRDGEAAHAAEAAHAIEVKQLRLSISAANRRKTHPPSLKQLLRIAPAGASSPGESNRNGAASEVTQAPPVPFPSSAAMAAPRIEYAAPEPRAALHAIPNTEDRPIAANSARRLLQSNLWPLA